MIKDFQATNNITVDIYTLNNDSNYFNCDIPSKPLEDGVFHFWNWNTFISIPLSNIKKIKWHYK